MRDLAQTMVEHWISPEAQFTAEGHDFMLSTHSPPEPQLTLFAGQPLVSLDWSDLKSLKSNLLEVLVVQESLQLPSMHKAWPTGQTMPVGQSS